MEAALVIPILLIIVFGIIEMSMAMRDYAVVASNTRVGARIASTGAAAGQCKVGLAECTATASPVLAQAAANAIQRAGSAMPRDNIEYIMIFRANSDGFPGAEGIKTMPSTCPANCVKYTWVDAQDRFRYNSGSWASSTINACFPANLERVGVFLQAKHPFVTGLFGASVPLADRTVQEFEPLAAAACKAGEHA